MTWVDFRAVSGESVTVYNAGALKQDIMAGHFGIIANLKETACRSHAQPSES